MIDRTNRVNVHIPKPVGEVYRNRQASNQMIRDNLRKFLRDENPELAALANEYSQAGFSLVEHNIRKQTLDDGPEKLKLEADILKLEEKLSRLAVELEEAYQEAEAKALKPEDLYYCPKCEDTGDDDGKLCECALEIIRNLEKERGISFPLPHNHNLADYDLSLFVDTVKPEWYQGRTSPYRVAQHFLSVSKALVDQFPQSDQAYYFFGKPGTGKTWLATAIANDLKIQGYSTAFISSMEYLDLSARKRTLDQIFNPDPEEFNRIHDSVAFINEADVLILDDLGSEHIGSRAYADLISLLDKRLQLPHALTIVTGNLSPLEFSSHYDERMGSRLTGGFQLFSFSGEDLRLAQAKRRR